MGFKISCQVGGRGQKFQKLFQVDKNPTSIFKIRAILVPIPDV